MFRDTAVAILSIISRDYSTTIGCNAIANFRILVSQMSFIYVIKVHFSCNGVGFSGVAERNVIITNYAHCDYLVLHSKNRFRDVELIPTPVLLYSLLGKRISIIMIFITDSINHKANQVIVNVVHLMVYFIHYLQLAKDEIIFHAMVFVCKVFSARGNVIEENKLTKESLLDVNYVFYQDVVCVVISHH